MEHLRNLADGRNEPLSSGQSFLEGSCHLPRGSFFASAFSAEILASA